MRSFLQYWDPKVNWWVVIRGTRQVEVERKVEPHIKQGAVFRIGVQIVSLQDFRDRIHAGGPFTRTKTRLIMNLKKALWLNRDWIQKAKMFKQCSKKCAVQQKLIEPSWLEACSRHTWLTNMVELSLRKYHEFSKMLSVEDLLSLTVTATTSTKSWNKEQIPFTSLPSVYMISTQINRFVSWI